MKQMFTTKEMVEKLGIDRSVLNKYKNLGLVVPHEEPRDSDPGKAKWWRYSEEKYQRLKALIILEEVGYKRKELGKILDPRQTDVEKAFDEAILKLEQKKKELDKKIKFMEFYKKIAADPGYIEAYELPPGIVHRAEEAVRNTTGIRGFTGMLKTIFKTPKIIKKEDLDMAVDMARVNACWTSLAMLNGSDPGGSEAQECVYELNKSLRLLVEEKKGASLEELGMSDEMIADFCCQMMADMLSDRKIIDDMEKHCGKGAADFVIKACEHYLQQLKAAK